MSRYAVAMGASEIVTSRLAPGSSGYVHRAWQLGIEREVRLILT